MASPRAYVTPSVLLWARESVALDLARAATKIDVSVEQLERAEHGDHLLTLRQAERAAEAYGRAFAELFMPRPPNEPTVETRFRMLRGVSRGPWSHELVKLERDIRRRQKAMTEIYAALGEDPPWLHVASSLRLGHEVPSEDVVRHLLHLEPPILRAPSYNSYWHSRKIVLRAIEWTGVLVIRQSVPDDGVRGFLLPHPEVPAIFVNSADDPRAQAYTIVHEFAHLLVAHLGLSEDDEEARCDLFAGRVLMPRDDFIARFKEGSSSDAVATASAVAREFGVTPFAAAVRARQLDLFTFADVDRVQHRQKLAPRESSGGDGNRNKVSRLSPTFTDMVLTAADASAVTLSAASRLLRTKIDDFDKLRRFTAEALAE